jgi:hypothetical protein
MADEAADRAADASIPRPYRCILSSLHPERQRLRRCDCTMNYLRGFFSLYGRINRIQYAMVMLIGYLGSLAIFALTWLAFEQWVISVYMQALQT